QSLRVVPSVLIIVLPSRLKTSARIPALCPSRAARFLPVAVSHTSSSSRPLVARSLPSGEKRTQLAFSLRWPIRRRSFLAVRSHRATARCSLLLAASTLPSAETSSASTGPSNTFRLARSLPALTSHNLTVPSRPAERRVFPSGKKARLVAYGLWPARR